MPDAISEPTVSLTKGERDSTVLAPENTPRAGSNWCLVGLFLLAAVYAFHFARALLLPIVLAILFSLLLSPIVSWLRKLHLPEPHERL